MRSANLHRGAGNLLPVVWLSLSSLHLPMAFGPRLHDIGAIEAGAEVLTLVARADFREAVLAVHPLVLSLLLHPLLRRLWVGPLLAPGSLLMHSKRINPDSNPAAIAWHIFANPRLLFLRLPGAVLICQRLSLDFCLCFGSRGGSGCGVGGGTRHLE